MKHITLGGLDVSRIGLGAMTMAGMYTTGGGTDDDESIRAIHRALDLGVTHIDTAESTVHSIARKSSVGRLRIGVTRLSLPRSSAWCRTPVVDPGSPTAVQRTSAQQSRAP